MLGEPERVGELLIPLAASDVLAVKTRELVSNVVGLTKGLVVARGSEPPENVDCGREPDSAGVPELKEAEAVTIVLPAV